MPTQIRFKAFNAQYLQFVQEVAREDRNRASHLFGISECDIDYILELSPAELLEKACSDMMIFTPCPVALATFKGEQSNPVDIIKRI